MSQCGREMNYIRCNDLPIVFTHLLDYKGEVIQDIASYAQGPSRDNSELLSYGGTGNLLTVPFEPEKLCMLPGGRVYHTGPNKAGGAGLVKSSLALELSPLFQYNETVDPETAAPMWFSWRGVSHDLDYSILFHIQQFHHRIKSEVDIIQ